MPLEVAKDAVVGCISGLNLNQLAPWMGSLDTCGFSGRRIIIHLGCDPSVVAELCRRGWEAYDASVLHGPRDRKLREDPTPDEISVNRFYYIWHFLSKDTGPPIRHLIAVDARDVIFQRNPSHWLESHLGEKRLVVGCESLHFEDEPWNAETMRNSFGPEVWEAYRRNLIYNAGTIAGELRTMVDLCLQVYLLSPGEWIHYSDQAALNLLLGLEVYRRITLFASSEDGWACQAGTTAEPRLLEQVRDRLASPLPQFDGEYVRTAGGEIYVLVHQYDRVPQWDVPLKRKHGSPHVSDSV
ncbi:MAG: hypothetical protein ABI806_20605 [Candidatus Solibacter sp.]